ncbi:peptidoglycan DD-metalloendopeptidase family protein [Candidatus Falkowbacteria bacterium]|nr:peptidoglycan DD-metalloendopeptidase family protein [Candidatus Falkowbacteria bacterium]
MKSPMQTLKITKWLVIPTVLGLFVFGAFLTWGKDDTDVSNEINKLNREIKLRRQKAESIQKKQEEYTAALKQKQSEKLALIDELGLLDNRIAATQLEIERLQTEMDQTTLEIKKTELEISGKEEDISRDKDHVSTVLRLLYKQDRTDALEVLLLNDSFSEFLNQVKYLEDVNQELAQGLESLKRNREELDQKRTELKERNDKLTNLKADLDKKVASLETEREGKNFLIDQTAQSEAEFEKLISQAKQEQSQAAADVVELERAVRNKLSQKQQQKLELNPSGMIWPVPKNTITTYFHDPDYPFRYVFEHPAVDIRAAQGTTIRASASGYVARAKDAGMGYSYVMLIHGDNLATVYGHVSKILVDEDQYVVQGQPIAISGGTPGTPGAGKLTTGPHLHFEVRLNGIPVNPLEYLP